PQTTGSIDQTYTPSNRFRELALTGRKLTHQLATTISTNPHKHSHPTTNNTAPPHTGDTPKGVNKVTAVHSGRETPGPIPNPEAKPASANDTTQPGWKSRTPPNTI